MASFMVSSTDEDKLPQLGTVRIAHLFLGSPFPCSSAGDDKLAQPASPSSLPLSEDELAPPPWCESSDAALVLFAESSDAAFVLASLEFGSFVFCSNLLWSARVQYGLVTCVHVRKLQMSLMAFAVMPNWGASRAARSREEARCLARKIVLASSAEMTLGPRDCVAADPVEAGEAAEDGRCWPICW